MHAYMYTYIRIHTYIHTYIATVKAIETIKITNNFPITITITIHTDSRIILEPLNNMKNRKHLTEEIKKKTIELERENWNIEYSWIKADAGHYGNDLADKLAKEATGNSDICYNKIPKSKT
jgi:ribonuclease HI